MTGRPCIVPAITLADRRGKQTQRFALKKGFCIWPGLQLFQDRPIAASASPAWPSIFSPTKKTAPYEDICTNEKNRKTHLQANQFAT